MICFRDMSFCSDSGACANADTCDRDFNEEQQKAAANWWGNNDAPVAFMPFKDSCKDYVERNQHDK